MAFDNVTLFEVHLDDAKLSTFFGSESAEEDHRDDEMIVEAASDDEMDAEMADDDAMDEDAVAPSRGRGFVRFVAVAAVVGIAYAALRRRAGDAMDAEMDADAHVEMGDDAEHVEIDEAAPQ
jgi:hypothetical protein